MNGPPIAAWIRVTRGAAPEVYRLERPACRIGARADLEIVLGADAPELACVIEPGPDGDVVTFLDAHAVMFEHRSVEVGWRELLVNNEAITVGRWQAHYAPLELWATPWRPDPLPAGCERAARLARGAAAPGLVSAGTILLACDGPHAGWDVPFYREARDDAPSPVTLVPAIALSELALTTVTWDEDEMVATARTGAELVVLEEQTPVRIGGVTWLCRYA